MKYTPLENLSWEAFVAILNRAEVAGCSTHTEGPDKWHFTLPFTVTGITAGARTK